MSAFLLFALHFIATDLTIDQPIHVDSPATNAAKTLLAAMTAESRKVAVFRLDDVAQRKDWHWIPKPIRRGRKLRDMNATERSATLKLLATVLSPTGYSQVESIWTRESLLKDLEKDVNNVRDPLKYYLSIFGEPTDTGTWFLCLEGHHLSLNFQFIDGKQAPSGAFFFGANPAYVKTTTSSGPAIGSQLLTERDAAALKFICSLDDRQKKLALLDRDQPKHLVSGPPTGQPPAHFGIAGNQLNENQRQLLFHFTDTYLMSLPKETADSFRAEWKTSFGKDWSIAWWGSMKTDAPHYFAIRSSNLLLELDNSQTDPSGNPANHIHSALRMGDFVSQPTATSTASTTPALWQR